jgi:hypothetical protein
MAIATAVQILKAGRAVITVNAGVADGSADFIHCIHTVFFSVAFHFY